MFSDVILCQDIDYIYIKMIFQRISIICCGLLGTAPYLRPQCHKRKYLNLQYYTYEIWIGVPEASVKMRR